MLDPYDLYDYGLGTSGVAYIRTVLWLLIWFTIGYFIAYFSNHRLDDFYRKLPNYITYPLITLVAILSFVLSYYVIRFIRWIVLFDPY